MLPAAFLWLSPLTVSPCGGRQSRSWFLLEIDMQNVNCWSRLEGPSMFGAVWEYSFGALPRTGHRNPEPMVSSQGRSQKPRPQRFSKFASQSLKTLTIHRQVEKKTVTFVWQKQTNSMNFDGVKPRFSAHVPFSTLSPPLWAHGLSAENRPNDGAIFVWK